MLRHLLSLQSAPLPHSSGERSWYSKPAVCGARRAKEVGITALLVVLLYSCSALADDFGLGTAGPGNWGILETGTAETVSITSPAGIETAPGGTSDAANLGINNGSKLTGSGGLIQGTYYKFTGNSDSNTSLTALAGTISSPAGNSIISQAASSATSASTTLAALSADQTFTAQIKASTTITATVPGRNVINLQDGVSMSGANQILTLSGSSSQSFVINVPNGGISLSNADSIVLTGGLTPANVIFNVSGLTGDTVSLNNNSVINGIVMDLNNTVNMNNAATINGEIIGGNNINMSNNAQVEVVVPEASTAAYFTLGPLSLVAVMLLHRRFSRRKQIVVSSSHDPALVADQC